MLVSRRNAPQLLEVEGYWDPCHDVAWGVAYRVLDQRVAYSALHHGGVLESDAPRSRHMNNTWSWRRFDGYLL